MEKVAKSTKALLAVVLACALALPAPALAWAAEGDEHRETMLTLAPAQTGSVWDGSSDTSWYSATASSFTLTTAEQLAGLAQIVNGTAEGIPQDSFSGKTVTLGADVVLNATAATGRDATGTQRNWTPIGSLVLQEITSGVDGSMPIYDDPYYFDGTFDGCGHVIRNIYIYDNVPGTYGGVQGLFANVGGHALICNTGIDGGYVYGRVAAGIAAISHASATDYPHFIGCFNAATIEGNGSTSRGVAGIFAGEEQHRADDNYHGGAYIANCYNVGTIKRAAGGSPAAGGIAGTGSVQIYGCYNYGDIVGSSMYAGALAGNLIGATQRVGQGKATAFFGASDVRDSYAVQDCILADDAGIMKLYNYIDADHPKGGRDDANPAVEDAPTAKFQSAAWFAGSEAPAALSMSYAKGEALPVLYWQAGLAQLALTDTDDAGFVRTSVAEIPAQGYTGSALEPAVDAVYNTGTFARPVEVSLHEGSDFTVVYADNTDIGTAKVNIYGIGRFVSSAAQSVSTTFKIYNGNLESVVIQPIPAQWYYGTPVTPEVTVLATNGDELQQGTDCQLEFTGNENPSFDADGKAVAMVTVKPAEGSDLFTGSKSQEFTILKASQELQTDAEGAYLISSKADLQYLAWMTSTGPGAELFAGKTFKLACDVDASSSDNTYRTDRPADPLYTFWSKTAGGFSGVFDGCGHTLTIGLTEGGLSLDTGTALAPFVYTKTGGSATFKNVTIEGSANSPNRQAAGLLVMGQSGAITIDNVVNRASIRGNMAVYGSAAGLVVETSQGSDSAGMRLVIKDCRNEGEITSSVRGAGFIGALGARTATFNNCVNAGTVTGGFQGASGFVALVLGASTPNGRVAQIAFEDCRNEGSVTTKTSGDAGGFVGWNQDYVKLISFNRCANVGTVTYTGPGCIGAGIVGRASSPVTIENTYNNAAIISTGTGNRPAGILGYAAPGPLSGKNYETISFKNVYSTGSFGTRTDGGGIVGIAWLSTRLVFDNVYYDSDVASKGIGYNFGEEWPDAIDPTITVGDPIAQDSATMKTQTFASMLGSAFAVDEPNVTGAYANGGFPMLASEAVAPVDLSEGFSVSEATPSVFEYTGGALKLDPFEVVASKGAKLQEGKDYIVFYAADGLAGRAVVQGIGAYRGSFTYNFEIAPCSLQSCRISQVRSISYSECAGGAAVQDISITSPAGTVMEEGRDYEVLYTRNTEPGIAYALITGKGYYSGSVLRMFTISKGDLASVAVEGIDEHYPIANGTGGLYVYEQLKAESGYTLVRSDTPYDEADYVRFFYDENGELVKNASGGAAVSLTKAGIYTVVLRAPATDSNGREWTNGFWEGEASATFSYGNRIAQDADASGVASVYGYTGEALDITPVLTSKTTGYALTQGVDYTLSFQTKAGAAVDVVRDAGEYTAVITGKGSWFGTREIAFTVQPAEFFIGEDTRIQGIDAQYFDDGEALLPVPSHVNIHGSELYQDVEYVVTYEDDQGNAVLAPQGVGSYRAVITGVGAYKGSVRVPFDIVKTYMSVYARQGSGEARLVKRYSKEQFEALRFASAATTPVSALYCNGRGSGWSVAATTDYVMLNDVLADAGATWAEGCQVEYGDANGTAASCSYAEASAAMFYPSTTASAADSLGGVSAPFVLALTEGQATVGDEGTTFAAEAQTVALGKQTANFAPRAVMGVQSSDYAQATARANAMSESRLVKNVAYLTVSTPLSTTVKPSVSKAANTLTAKGKTVKVKYSKKARIIKAAKAYKISKAKGNKTFLKKGKSKLSVNKKTGAIKVPKALKPGTYKIKVTVRAAGNSAYRAAVKTVTVKVVVRK